MKQNTADICRCDYDMHRLNTSIPMIKLFAVTVGLFNLLLLVPDLSNVGRELAVPIIALRVIYALIMAALFFAAKKLKTFSTLAAVMTAMEIAAVAQFLIVFSLYPAPDLLIQMLSMILLVIMIFLVPNIWMLKLVTAALGSSAFLLISCSAFAGDNTVRLAAGAVYLGIVIIICASFTRYLQHMQYREYVMRIKLEAACATDPLTNAGNRNRLNQSKNLIEQLRHQGRPLALILLDIDNLKQVNDSFGHAVGDAILHNTAKIMHRLMGKSDICIRWGGDEFILLLPDASLSAAKKLAESIRQAIGSQQFGDGIALTCSLGIAAMKTGQSLEDLIAEADASMYHAKKSGKDAVVISEMNDTPQNHC